MKSVYLLSIALAGCSLPSLALHRAPDVPIRKTLEETKKKTQELKTRVNELKPLVEEYKTTQDLQNTFTEKCLLVGLHHTQKSLVEQEAKYTAQIAHFNTEIDALENNLCILESCAQRVAEAQTYQNTLNELGDQLKEIAKQPLNPAQLTPAQIARLTEELKRNKVLAEVNAGLPSPQNKTRAEPK